MTNHLQEFLNAGTKINKPWLKQWSDGFINAQTDHYRATMQFAIHPDNADQLTSYERAMSMVLRRLRNCMKLLGVEDSEDLTVSDVVNDELIPVNKSHMPIEEELLPEDSEHTQQLKSLSAIYMRCVACATRIATLLDDTEDSDEDIASTVIYQKPPDNEEVTDDTVLGDTPSAEDAALGFLEEAGGYEPPAPKNTDPKDENVQTPASEDTVISQKGSGTDLPSTADLAAAELQKRKLPAKQE